jgi:hypothetical protein
MEDRKKTPEELRGESIGRDAMGEAAEIYRSSPELRKAIGQARKRLDEAFDRFASSSGMSPEECDNARIVFDAEFIFKIAGDLEKKS